MMETLVVVAQHRNQYCSRGRAHGAAKFVSPPSRGFRDINCRTFQSGSGILPTPLKVCTNTVTKRACSSPKTPSSSVKCQSEDSKRLKKPVKSSAISIPINIEADFNKNGFFSDDFTYSELWAGPAYSNSPPPSSLPMPKFSLRPKRTVSLDLPVLSASDIDFHPIAKSAPPSPTRDHSSSSSKDLFCSADSATKTLRRILNLDISDE
ncbi:hypothetical protein NMG60_11013999 [Bertholletia excelsa]